MNLNRPISETLRAFVPSCESKPVPSRRDFLWELGGSLGGVVLAAMMNEAHARRPTDVHGPIVKDVLA